jgi:hypothetical protein
MGLDPVDVGGLPMVDWVTAKVALQQAEARAAEAEAQLTQEREARRELEERLDWIERDRREPDKVLCALQSARRILNRFPAPDTKGDDPCERTAECESASSSGSDPSPAPVPEQRDGGEPDLLAEGARRFADEDRAIAEREEGPND